MSIISEQTDAISYVPEVFAKIGVRPTSCQLTVKKLDGNKAHYTYQLHWESEGEPEGAPLTLADLSAALSASNTNIRQKDDYESSETESVKPSIKNKIKKCLSSSSNHQLLLCDGPCGNKYPPTGLQLLGRCDHRLCNNCSGIITNLDGSPGCSAMSCSIFRFYDFLPEPLAKEAYENQIRKKVMEKEKLNSVGVRVNKTSLYGQAIPGQELGCRGSGSGLELTIAAVSPRRATGVISQSSRGSSVSSASTNSTLFGDLTLRSPSQVLAPEKLENVFVRLMVLERQPGSMEKKIYKRVMEEEMPSTTTVKAAIGGLLGDSSSLLMSSAHVVPIRLYFYAGLKGDRMRKLSREEYEKKSLVDFTRNHGPVHFVLDAAEGVKKV